MAAHLTVLATMPQVWQRLQRIETLAEQISAAQNSKQGSNRVANGHSDGPINGVSGLPANAAAHHHPRPQTASDRSTPSQVSASELHEKHIKVVIMIVLVVHTGQPFAAGCMGSMHIDLCHVSWHTCAVNVTIGS